MLLNAFHTFNPLIGKCMEYFRLKCVFQSVQIDSTHFMLSFKLQQPIDIVLDHVFFYYYYLQLTIFL